MSWVKQTNSMIWLFFQFSDNTAILSLFHQNSDPSLYFTEVFDPRSVGDHTPLSIHREEIKQVTSYRYLGIHLDNLFSWCDHVDCVCSLCIFLCRLRVFGVSQNITFLFYQAVMESVTRYEMTAWFSSLSTQSKSKLQCLVQTAIKVMGRTDKLSLQSTYEQSALS